MMLFYGIEFYADLIKTIADAIPYVQTDMLTTGLYDVLFFICRFDSILPVHDGFVPFLEVSSVIAGDLLVLKLVMAGLNLVRGSGAKM